MSAEDTFRAALAAHAPLVTLVGTRIVENAVEQGMALPYIVFSSTHLPELSLDNQLLADQVTHTIECWGSTSIEAGAVADAVTTAALAADIVVTGRIAGYDTDTRLDAVVLTAEHWAD